MSRILIPTEATIAEVADALQRGELVGMPTETVYGLAANALDPSAVARIFDAKTRPSFNPLIVHIKAQTPADLAARGLIDPTRLSPRATSVANRLAQLWPSPLTIVLPRGPKITDIVTGGLDTVGLRAPDHPVAQALLRRISALAAPSANRSGSVSPTTARDVLDGLGPELFAVLDGGACRVGIESTVVRVLENGDVVVLRTGFWSAEALSEHTGQRVTTAEDHPERPRSPGTTLRHYAPAKPFYLLPSPLDTMSIEPWLAGRTAAVLCWNDAAAARIMAANIPGVSAMALHPTGEPAGVAQALYATIRRLDNSPAEILLCEPMPPSHLAYRGLLHAIHDRIVRSTTPWPHSEALPSVEP